MTWRPVRLLLYALAGATPGLLMVLVAQFLIEAEMQLTVGAPGFVLAAIGAVVGFLLGLRWRRTDLR